VGDSIDHDVPEVDDSDDDEVADCEDNDNDNGDDWRLRENGLKNNLRPLELPLFALFPSPPNPVPAMPPSEEAAEGDGLKLRDSAWLHSY